MLSGRREILFRSLLGESCALDRCYSDAVAELERRVEESPPGIWWEELGHFLGEHARRGHMVAGFLGYEMLHAVEEVPRLARSDDPLDQLPDLHLVAFQQVQLGQPPSEVGPTPAVRRAQLPHDLEPDLSRATYVERVAAMREAILRGDIFEACFTQGLTVPCDRAPDQLYEGLLRLSPARCTTLFSTPEYAVISNSPETLLRASSRHLESRPIKGTRPRGATVEEDRAEARALLRSDKDRAELAMIVDLTRNDLGRVAVPGSVRVEHGARLSTLANVHHLEGVVTAERLPGQRLTDCIRAVFPGGSVTGAPKVRAMQLIASLEARRRGPYCGALLVCEPDGRCHLSVGIRTGVIAGGRLRFGSGGAVTADSDPEEEYEEHLDKAAVFLELVR